MGDPLFSVVIPTFGRPALLAEAVRSVRLQDRDDVECIVVDDAGSVPASVTGDRITVIRHAINQGLSGARNTGIEAASGRYVTFLDDDDLLAPRRFEIASAALARAPVAICFRGDHPGGRPGRNRILEGWVHDDIAIEAVPHVGQACVERDALVPFDRSLRAGEEIDWWLRLSAGTQVATEPEIGYLFRLHDGARPGSGSRERMQARLVVMDRHADYFHAHPQAAAFQWKRVGLLAERAGDHQMARDAFRRSLRLRREPRTAWHVARTSMVRDDRRPA
jgi:glycosyltransferase involved in cell wall biosynthesis